jgi:hypothetical protein
MRARFLDLAVVTFCSPVLAQPSQAVPTFEVVSVKRNVSGDERTSNIVLPGGRYTATNVTLRMLMKTAYGVHDDQIIGGPPWDGRRIEPLSPTTAAQEGLSLFTALQEQLGLKLEPTRGLVDVRVVDRVERPTPD